MTDLALIVAAEARREREMMRLERDAAEAALTRLRAHLERAAGEGSDTVRIDDVRALLGEPVAGPLMGPQYAAPPVEAETDD